MTATAAASRIVTKKPASTRAEMLWRTRRGCSQPASRPTPLMALVYSAGAAVRVTIGSEVVAMAPPSRSARGGDDTLDLGLEVAQHVGGAALAAPERAEALVDRALHLGGAGEVGHGAAQLGLLEEDFCVVGRLSQEDAVLAHGTASGGDHTGAGEQRLRLGANEEAHQLPGGLFILRAAAHDEAGAAGDVDAGEVARQGGDVPTELRLVGEPGDER